MGSEANQVAATLDDAEHRVTARLWVHRLDGPSHRLELELGQDGHFKLRIAPPPESPGEPVQIHEGYLWTDETSVEEALERG